jgi:CubicO group peptidase (beta-lactamase class C family)
VNILRRNAVFFALPIALTLASNTLASDPVEASVQSYLMAHQVPGAAVALVRDGKVVKEVISGSANLQLSVPVQRSSVFQLASVTKIFTAITLLQLEQAGKLNLDDPLARYLPELPKEWESVTLGQLASHTSGLPDIIANSDKPLTDVELARSADDALKYAESNAIIAPPGSQFKYDQTNYLLLLRIIENVCQEAFRECVTSHLLKPTGMVRTSWGDARSLVSGRTDMYTALHGDPIQNGTNLFAYPSYLDAAAGLNSDIVDMEQLAIALTTGKLLSSTELQRMWEPARNREGAVVDIANEMEISGVVAPAAGWFYADNSGGGLPHKR